MDIKEQVLEMYKDTTRRIVAAMKGVIGTEQGSPEHGEFERIYGERIGYSRILKELCGVEAAELQQILDEIYDEEYGKPQ